MLYVCLQGCRPITSTVALSVSAAAVSADLVPLAAAVSATTGRSRLQLCYLDLAKSTVGFHHRWLEMESELAALTRHVVALVVVLAAV